MTRRTKYGYGKWMNTYFPKKSFTCNKAAKSKTLKFGSGTKNLSIPLKTLLLIKYTKFLRRFSMKKLIYLFAMAIIFSACSSNVDANKKMAGDFLDLALSANPLDAQELTHPDFKFVFMGNTEISNIPYDRDAYFDYWLPEVVGKLLPTGITLTTTDMIADDDGVAVIMEGDAEGINGEYDNKYVFVYKFKDGKIFSIHEYNSDLLVATRLYKNKLVPID